MDGGGRWHCGGAQFAADCTQAGQQQKGGIRSLCGLCDPTGACHGDSALQLDRINSDGSIGSIEDCGLGKDVEDFGLGNPSLEERTFLGVEMKPVMGGKLLTSSGLVKSSGPVIGGKLLMSSGLVKSSGPVIGSGLVKSKEPVTGNLAKKANWYWK